MNLEVGKKHPKSEEMRRQMGDNFKVPERKIQTEKDRKNQISKD